MTVQAWEAQELATMEPPYYRSPLFWGPCAFGVIAVLGIGWGMFRLYSTDRAMFLLSVPLSPVLCGIVIASIVTFARWYGLMQTVIRQVPGNDVRSLLRRLLVTSQHLYSYSVVSAVLFAFFLIAIAVSEKG